MNRSRFFLASLFLSLGAISLGCSGSSSSVANGGGPGGGDDGGGGGGGQGDDGGVAVKPRKVCSGFASTTSNWKVPSDTYDAVNATYGQWLTLDLDGDGHVDLVRAADPNNAGHAFTSGTSAYWEFYKGTDGGFATTASHWSVPDASYDAVRELYGTWVTIDLDGDGHVDLVRAADPNNAGHAFGVGAAAHWQIFKGAANGFASQAANWMVPDDTYDAVSEVYSTWVTMDLDGDGHLDLVRAADPNNAGHAHGVGASAHWAFFKGGANGFAQQPASFAVPDDTYDAVRATYGTWVTLDIDGDGHPDLVRAADPNNAGHAYGAGSAAHWQVYKGSATGFSAQATAWSVPDDSYDAVSAIYGEWVTFDLDDDGKVDLVRAQDPKNSGHAFTEGTSAYWQFFRGTGSGFESTASHWSVPDSTYDAINAVYSQWVTIDLDGDGCGDLVHAADPNNAGHAYAGPAWHYFPAQGK